MIDIHIDFITAVETEPSVFQTPGQRGNAAIRGPKNGTQETGTKGAKTRQGACFLAKENGTQTAGLATGRSFYSRPFLKPSPQK
jgi:hypothetical protein